MTMPAMAPRTRIPVPSRSRPDAHVPWRELFLVRHGESTCNEVNRFAGRIDAPLTALGFAQARRAATTWQGAPPDRIFVSPLVRSRDTAEVLFPVADFAIPHQIDDRITERDFGSFTLRNKAELQRTLGIRGFDEALYDSTGAIPEAEIYARFRSRVSSFLFDTVVPLLQSGQRVLVVAHKYVIELMARLILQLPHGNGFDLRLPSAQVLRADRLAPYVRGESRRLNRLRDWGVLHHGRWFAAAAGIGVLLAWSEARIVFPWWVALGLLMLATTLSLARVDLRAGLAGTAPSWSRVVFRYAILPAMAAWIAMQAQNPLPWICAALVLTAPTALTSLTLSRCAGGLILPCFAWIHRSSLVGGGALFLLAGLLLETQAGMVAPLLLGLTLGAIWIPAWLSHRLRQRSPIATATFADRHAILSVMLVAILISLSVAQLDVNGFFPYGLVAVATSLIVRGIATALARRRAWLSVDDFLSMAYPNVFVVMLLAQALDLTALAQISTWFLVPMFLLSPLDALQTRRSEPQGVPAPELRSTLAS